VRAARGLALGAQVLAHAARGLALESKDLVRAAKGLALEAQVLVRAARGLALETKGHVYAAEHLARVVATLNERAVEVRSQRAPRHLIARVAGRPNGRVTRNRSVCKRCSREPA
jgi:hypothetical protein